MVAVELERQRISRKKTKNPPDFTQTHTLLLVFGAGPGWIVTSARQAPTFMYVKVFAFAVCRWHIGVDTKKRPALIRYCRHTDK